MIFLQISQSYADPVPESNSAGFCEICRKPNFDLPSVTNWQHWASANGVELVLE